MPTISYSANTIYVTYAEPMTVAAPWTTTNASGGYWPSWTAFPRSLR